MSAVPTPSGGRGFEADVVDLSPVDQSAIEQVPFDLPAITRDDSRTAVAAIVVTHNSTKDLVSLISSGMMERTFSEIVVVDNASTDGSDELARQAGWRVIALDENIGFAGAANLGAANTATDFFVVMNPDIGIRDPGHLAELTRHFDDPTVGLVAPRLRLPSGEIQDSAREVPRPLALARRRIFGLDHGRIGSDLPTDVPWVVGAFLLIRRESHVSIDGLDARYPLYFEDVDYCVRLWSAGWRVHYDPTVEMDHMHQATSRRRPFSKASRWHAQSAVRFYRRHPRHLYTTALRRLPTVPRIHLAASPGGHMHLLRSTLSALDDFPRTWVTADGSHCDDLRSTGERVITVPRVRGVGKLQAIIGGVKSAWLAVRERPDLVVTSGADLVIPFAMVARLLGAKLFYVESITRIHTESMSGRIVGRWCQRHFVQWPELERRSNATLVWPETFAELPPTLPRRRGTGTFVTVGTHTDDFSRLTDAVCAAAEAGVLPMPVLLQYGSSTKPTSPAVDARRWLTADEVREQYAAADLIITHGGSGSVLGAMIGGLRPLVMPRSSAHGEHVDDHQAELVERLGELGLLVPIETTITRSMVEQTQREAAVPVRPEHIPTLDAALRAELAPIAVGRARP